VGVLETIDADVRAILWDQGQQIELVRPEGGWSWTSAINDAGQLVGGVATADGESFAVLWEGQQPIELAVSGMLWGAFGINNAGQVIGLTVSAAGEDYIFLWEAGQMRALDEGEVMAYDINNAGQVVGVMEMSPEVTATPMADPG
jgi:probable HAF family extracellular repeat protein